MSGGLRVQPVAEPAELEAFIGFPFRLHRDEPHWVPPLLMERRDFYDPKKNPLYEYAQVQLFAARRGAGTTYTIGVAVPVTINGVASTLSAIAVGSPVEITFSALGIDPKQADQAVRGSIVTLSTV